MSEERFVSHDSSVQDDVENIENKNAQKGTWDVKLLKPPLTNAKTRAKVVHPTTRRSSHVSRRSHFHLRRKDKDDYEPPMEVS